MGILGNLIAYTESKGGSHPAGTFAPDVLERIDLLLDRHLGGKKIRSAETGCGGPTVLLSARGGEHIVYCPDDTAEENSAVAFVRQCPLFKPRTTRFIFGPTLKTLLNTPPTGPFDLVLIDGPHAFPFPEVQYFLFYETIRPGGVLIVDDIHIPTIRRLFDVIRADDMFMLHSVVRRTAFFVRTGEPALSREGDGWTAQRYNAQRFPSPIEDLTRGTVLPLPAILNAENIAGALAPSIDRGFVTFEGKFATEGKLSILRIVLGKGIERPLRVSLELTPLFTAERQGPGCQILAQHKVVENLTFEGDEADPRRLTFTIPNPGELLHLRFNNYGVRQLRHLRGANDMATDLLQLGVAISALDLSLE